MKSGPVQRGALPGIFSGRPPTEGLPAEVRKADVPRTTQLNRSALGKEVEAVVAAAKKLSGSMPPDAAAATVRGTTELLDLIDATVNKLADRHGAGPLPAQERARILSQISKLEKSLSALGAAVLVEARTPSKATDERLAQLGTSTEQTLRALSEHRELLGLAHPRAFRLSRALTQMLSSSPAAEGAGFATWRRATSRDAFAQVDRHLSAGRLDCAAALLSEQGGWTGSVRYALEGAKLETEWHLQHGDRKAASNALDRLKRVLERSKKDSEPLDPDPHDPRPQPRTYADYDAAVAALELQLAKMEGTAPVRTVPPYTDLIARGRASIPPELAQLAGKLRQADEHTTRLRLAIRLAERDGNTETIPRLRTELQAQRREAELVKRHAVERMSELRAKLLNDSGLTVSDAGGLAASINMGREIESNERPALRDFAAEVLRLCSGRGIGTLHNFIRVEDRAAAVYGAIDVGKGVRRASIWHELGHHFEGALPGLAAEAQRWLKSRAINDEPKKFTELFPALGSVKEYDDHVGYRDKFVSYYVGRVYEGGETEAVSVGLEHFHGPGPMLHLLARDPDHFALILGALEHART